MKQTSGQVYHVAEAEQGRTLAAFLRAKLGGVPWSRVQKLVRSRHVLIHGNVCTDEARRLKDGEVVKVLDAAAPPPPKPRDVKIVYIDDDVVVVDKPSGITTTRHHEEASWPARRKQLQPTLDEMLPGIIGRALAGQAARQPRGAKTGGRPAEAKKPVRSGPVYPVHRIDRETSGLVVFARTVPAGRILAEQFRLHTTQRCYLAVAVGRVGEGTMMSNLVRDRGDGRRGSRNAATPEDADEGKRAVTHVKPVEHFGDAYTLVECRLETGRTHQIRIHLAESGHPLCGERVYSAPRGMKVVDRSGAARVALHAAELGFVHPKTGEQLHFESRLPPDIVGLLNRLRHK
jgi:23S rRNA pseudouridine1911/1915/1917 synthase